MSSTKIFGRPNPRTRAREVLPSTAASSAEAERTFDLDVDDCTMVSVRVQLVRSAATAITLGVSLGQTAASLAPLAVSAVGLASVAVTPTSYSYALAASGVAEFRIDTRGASLLRCIVGATSGGASDLLTVTAEGQRERAS
jgi:hypothetical protein